MELYKELKSMKKKTKKLTDKLIDLLTEDEPSWHNSRDYKNNCITISKEQMKKFKDNKYIWPDSK